MELCYGNYGIIGRYAQLTWAICATGAYLTVTEAWASISEAEWAHVYTALNLVCLGQCFGGSGGGRCTGAGLRYMGYACIALVLMYEETTDDDDICEREGMDEWMNVFAATGQHRCLRSEGSTKGTGASLLNEQNDCIWCLFLRAL